MRSLRPVVTLPVLLCACAAADVASLRRQADLRAPRSVALEAALSDQASRELRAEAAAAMGRIGSARYSPALRRALRDLDAAVRFQAVFALGQLWIDAPEPASPEVVADIIFAAIDADPRVRAAAVEALGKLGGADLEPRLAALVSDPEPAVRREAAIALFRLRFLKRIPSYSTGTVRALAGAFGDPDAETRWRSVYAFSRWPAPEAAGELAKAAEDEVPAVRLFALRGLAQLEAKAPEEPIRAALRDPDERVRTEAALAARKAGRAGLIGPDASKDPSQHARAAAAEALADPGGDLDLLERLARDRSPFARAKAIGSLAKRLGEKSAERLAAWARDPDPWIRLAACSAAGELPQSGEKLLEGCLRDPDVRAQAAALEALGSRPGSAADVALSVALSDPDSPMELRGAAMDAVSKRKTAELIPAVLKAYRGSAGADWVEVRESAVDAAEHLAGLAPNDARLKELREALLKDPAASVRAKAAKAFKAALEPSPGRPSPSRFLDAKPPAAALISLETAKGVVLIEPAGDLAPAHAASFLDLVRRGFYDGLSFHRVVSNFVVQGGDPRGSGWGGPGYVLRDEINPLKFARGTVGMAKAGRDTGGSQLFVCLVPAPHLDGRYTAFGRVVAGMDVVDRLIPGDVIRKASVR